MAQQMTHGLGSPVSERRTAGDLWGRALQLASRHARMIAPLTTLVGLFIFFSLVTEVFLTSRNLQNIVSQIGPVAVAAAGVTFVLLCAEIDLSIASVATFTGVLTAFLFLSEWTVSLFGREIVVQVGLWSILIGVVVAAVLGLINGFFVSYLGIPSFMMTLAMLTIALGLAQFVTKGKILPEDNVPPVLINLASAGSRPVFNLPGIGTIEIPFPIIGIVGLVALIVADLGLELHQVRPLRLHDRRQPRGGGDVRRQHA